jgi:hypothetical protein
MNPGSRNVAGETEPVALMPLQPAPRSAKAGRIAKRSNFQFNLTPAV